MKNLFDNQAINNNLKWLVDNDFNLQTIGDHTDFDFNGDCCYMIYWWKVNKSSDSTQPVFYLVNPKHPEFDEDIYPVCGKYWHKIRVRLLRLSGLIDNMKNGTLSNNDALSLISLELDKLKTTINSVCLKALFSYNKATLSKSEYKDFLEGFE